MTNDIAYGFAIETRYHGPTDQHGARISARLTDWTGRKVRPVFIPYPYELSGRDCHLAAARVMIGKWDAARADGKFRPLRIIASAGADRGYVFMAI